MTGSGKKENPVTIVVSGSNRMGCFRKHKSCSWLGLDVIKIGINFDIVCSNRHSMRSDKEK